LEPILCAPLIRRVDQDLLTLLRSLAKSDWKLATLAPRWQVRDVAAHLLDTALRKLSIVRDGCLPAAVEIRSEQDLVQFINQLNQEGVNVYRRLSPRLLIELTEAACTAAADFHEALDPWAPAAFGVSWAGEQQSLNWFDTARELTERWHHQQQIRLAVDRPGGLEPDIYFPVIDCFLRGLPHAYRQHAAAPGSTVCVEVSGEAGGRWYLTWQPSGWQFTAPREAQAQVTIPPAIAWRMFTKGISGEFAAREVSVQGDAALAEPVFALTAIVG